MKYAIFSDMHSNLEAYGAVLEAVDKEKVGGCYCCGDIVGYGADPIACVNKTRELNPHIVAGNHDWGAVGLADINNFTPNAKAAVEWTAKTLGNEEKEYLKALRLTHKIAPSPRPSPQRGEGGLIVHGSPNRPEEFSYLFGLNEAYPAFLQMQEDKIRVCFIGHTHAAGVLAEDMGYVLYHPWPSIKLQPEKKYIINVGSVGQPRDNDPRASYCIYDTDNGTIEIKRVSYDIKKAQEKIIKAGLPRALAERLSFGK